MIIESHTESNQFVDFCWSPLTDRNWWYIMWNRDGQSYSWVWKSWRGVIFWPYPFRPSSDSYYFVLVIHDSLERHHFWSTFYLRFKSEILMRMLSYSYFGIVSLIYCFISLFNSLSSLNMHSLISFAHYNFVLRVIIFDQRKGTHKLDTWSREMILEFF